VAEFEGTRLNLEHFGGFEIGENICMKVGRSDVAKYQYFADSWQLF